MSAPIWSHFEKLPNKTFAKCILCENDFSYKSSISNLKKHLKCKHKSVYQSFLKENYQPKANDNEDSNSSIKFSSEIWEKFEQDNDLARCTICQKTTNNTVEEMKLHLEEDHPAVLIRILKAKRRRESDAASIIGEEAPEEDTFTEVVYLEESKARKRPTFSNQPKRRKSVKPQAEPRVEYTIVNSEPKPNTEVDSFVNYISVLLKNVPKETFPKLQLDIISLILNAQMTAIPITAQQVIDTQKPEVCRTLNHNNIETSGYHITIQNNEKTTSCIT